MATTVNQDRASSQATVQQFVEHPPLLVAMDASLDRGERIDTLDLAAIDGKAKVDVADRLTGARVTLTIEGASTLELDVFDPDWEIEASGLLDKDKNGRLDAVAMTLDSLKWRLAKASRNEGETLTLTSEDEVWALLRAHRTHISSSRNAFTRAQFIERMVREIRLRKVPFYAPEKGRKQPIKEPDYPDAAPSSGTGFDKNATFTIKGVKADADQMRSVATVMTVADQLSVSPRVRLSALVAGIGESSFRKSATEHVYGTHHGVFQSNQIPASDLQAQAQHFFQGGRSFLAGGAIGLARENPSMSVGTIAAKVEISDGSAGYYDGFHDEGAKIADLWNGGSSTGGADTHEAVRIKSYRFTRGLPGQPENSAQAATRLADEVAWRFFVSGGVAYFVTDHFLVGQPAQLSLTGIYADGLMDRPTYEWDHRKLAANMSLTVAANAWQVQPGRVVVCHDMGPVTGRWIVETVEFDLFNPLTATISLIAPTKPKPEPAPDVFTVTVDSKGNTVKDDGIDSPGGSSTGKSVGGYVYPMGPGLTLGRTDMGVDFAGKGPIYAIGKAKVTRVAPQNSGTGWPGEGDAGRGNRGAMIVYELLEGSRQGKFVYLAENIDAVEGLTEGKQLEAGEHYATARGRFPYLEIGWAANAHGTTLASATTGYHEGEATAAGKDFLGFINRLK